MKGHEPLNRGGSADFTAGARREMPGVGSLSRIGLEEHRLAEQGMSTLGQGRQPCAVAGRIGEIRRIDELPAGRDQYQFGGE